MSAATTAANTYIYPTVALGIQRAAGQYALEATHRSGLVRLLRRLAG